MVLLPSNGLKYISTCHRQNLRKCSFSRQYGMAVYQGISHTLHGRSQYSFYPLPQVVTDNIQPVGAGEGYMMKKLIGRQLDS